MVSFRLYMFGSCNRASLVPCAYSSSPVLVGEVGRVGVLFCAVCSVSEGALENMGGAVAMSWWQGGMFPLPPWASLRETLVPTWFMQSLFLGFLRVKVIRVSRIGWFFIWSSTF